MLRTLFSLLAALASSACIGIAPPPFIPPPVLPERDSTPEAIECLDDECPQAAPRPALDDEPVDEVEPWRYVSAPCADRAASSLRIAGVDLLWAHTPECDAAPELRPRDLKRAVVAHEPRIAPLQAARRQAERAQPPSARP